MDWKKLLGLDEPLKRNYVSELDLFLQRFDKDNKQQAYSESRYEEEAKYARIFKLRDDPTLSNKQQNILDDF